ncbi:MAG TPA: hypothetical protein VF069_05935 [Streptosporangiaceae bacterium]
MPTPELTASTRYIDPGVTKCYYVPTIAAANLTPTRAELNAGTDLSREIADLSGWTVTANQVDTPDLKSTFTGKIPGRTEAADSSLTLYASVNGTDVRALLPRGTSGYIVWMDGGDVAGNKADVYPIRVASCSKVRTVSGTEAAKVMVSCAITTQPAENVTVPA